MTYIARLSFVDRKIALACHENSCQHGDKEFGNKVMSRDMASERLPMPPLETGYPYTRG